MLAVVYDNDLAEGDLAYASGSLQVDGLDLETAVLLSLHCDAPALATDSLPTGTPRRGWWGDSYDDDDAAPTGSRLWLLEGMTASEQTATLARGYAAEALGWLVADGHVKAVSSRTVVGDARIDLIPMVTMKNGETVQLSPLQVGI